MTRRPRLLSNSAPPESRIPQGTTRTFKIGVAMPISNLSTTWDASWTQPRRLLSKSAPREPRLLQGVGGLLSKSAAALESYGLLSKSVHKPPKISLPMGPESFSSGLSGLRLKARVTLINRLNYIEWGTLPENWRQSGQDRLLSKSAKLDRRTYFQNQSEAGRNTFNATSRRAYFQNRPGTLAHAASYPTSATTSRTPVGDTGAW